MGSVILVTGGAGYIGSHTVALLRERGREVLVLDDFCEGHRGALQGAPLAEGSLLDRGFVDRVFADNDVGSVFHFAARCLVGQSMTDPGLYYRQNVVCTLNLLEAMVAHGVRRFVLSSTAATYGDHDVIPIAEDAPQVPVNPYGESKLMCERMLRDFHRAHGIDSVSLRYFNAAGAHPDGHIGEDHEHETHLIPLVIQAVLGVRGPVKIFGDDWDTPDGTCVRDYVHVLDLAEAHLLAADAMEKGLGGARAFNLGNATGTSVREVIDTVQRVTRIDVPHEVGERRPGDPPMLVASSDAIASQLGWKPQFGSIETIVETAWRWHRGHPQGFDDG